MLPPKKLKGLVEGAASFTESFTSAALSCTALFASSALGRLGRLEGTASFTASLASSTLLPELHVASQDTSRVVSVHIRDSPRASDDHMWHSNLVLEEQSMSESVHCSIPRATELDIKL